MKFIKIQAIALLAMAMCACQQSAQQDGLAHCHDHEHAHNGHSHDHDGHAHDEHNHHEDIEHEHEHEHDSHAHEEKMHKHSGDEIILSAEQAKQFGVKAEHIDAGNFSPAIIVAGRIEAATSGTATVAAPSAGILKYATGMAPGNKVGNGSLIATVSGQNLSGGDANTAARIAYEAAKREYDRLKPLYADGIVTAATFNAARQTYETAESAYRKESPSNGGLRALSPISGVVMRLLATEGEFVEIGTPIAEISSASNLLLCAELPERYNEYLPQIQSARFSVGNESTIYSLDKLNGKKTGNPDAASAAGRPGYTDIYFSFNNNGTIRPGRFAQIYLLLDTRHNVISVPVSALVEQQGNYFVFVKVDDDCYKKCRVQTGSNNGNDVEILSGLKAGQEVVTAGAPIVKLAESSSVVPEGHSHSH